MDAARTSHPRRSGPPTRTRADARATDANQVVVAGDGLVDAMVQASFATMAVLSRVAADHDLSLTQLRVLAILRDRRPGMTELADHLGLEKSTVSGLVDRAEKRGLVRRAATPEDGRAIEVSLTAQGEELAKVVQARVAHVLTPLLGALAPPGRRQLQALLERMLTPSPR